MEIEKRIFGRAKPDFAALEAYGFAKTAQGYVYSKTLEETGLKAEITVFENGEVSGKVIDADTGDEYAPLRADNAIGNFVTAARDEYKALLDDIAGKCFHKELFAFPQSNRFVEHVREAYGEEPDFPWEGDDYGVFRYAANRKWYALIMNIPRLKLTKQKKNLTEEEKMDLVDVMNIKADPKLIPSLIQNEKGVYPCYHMSHAMWISILLDDSMSDERLYELVEKSREYAIGTIKKAKKQN